MKNIIALLFLLGTVQLQAQNRMDETAVIKSQATIFLTALIQLDFSLAKTVSTPETVKTLDVLKAYAADLDDSSRNDAKKIEFAISDIVADADECLVNFVTSNAPDVEDELLLVKRNGQWLVHLTLDMMNGGEHNLKENSGEYHRNSLPK